MDENNLIFNIFIAHAMFLRFYLHNFVLLYYTNNIMKKLSYIMLILGIIAIAIGQFAFTHLHTVNAVDSHRWAININGIRSFPWPTFTGYELIILGLIVYFTSESPKGKRFS